MMALYPKEHVVCETNKENAFMFPFLFYRALLSGYVNGVVLYFVYQPSIVSVISLDGVISEY